MGSSSVGGSAWHRVTLQRTVVIWVTTAVCVQPHEMSTTRFFIRLGTSRGRGTTRSVNLPSPSLPLPALLWTPDHTPTSAGSSTKSRPAGAAKPTAAAYPQTNTRPSAFTTAVCAYPHATRTSWRRKSAQQPSRRLVSRHTARCSPTARTHNVPETCQTSARAWALAQMAHRVRRRRSGARDRTGPRN